jgi:very-short-patch-repair endonuclease
MPCATRQSLSKELRKNQTPSERQVWERLRRRQLGGFKFRRQHQFGPFILDFYCPEAGIAVELDGPIHDDPASIEHDLERDAYLRGEGITLVRVANERVLAAVDEVLSELYELCRQRQRDWRGSKSRHYPNKHDQGLCPPRQPNAPFQGSPSPARSAMGKGQGVGAAPGDARGAGGCGAAPGDARGAGGWGCAQHEGKGPVGRACAQREGELPEAGAALST